MFNEMTALNKAMNLCYYELLGVAALINCEVEKYNEVSPVQIQRVAKEVLQKKNCSTLFYLSKNKV